MTHVAIIMRTKNRPRLLARAIEGVCAQTFKEWQLVVVNDGGDKKGVDEVLGRYAGQIGGRLVVIHNERSLGMEAASNIGIRSSESSLVVIHDDDDSWESDFLSATVRYLRDRPSVGGVVTHWHALEEDDSGERTSDLWRQGHRVRDLGLYHIATPLNNFPPIAFVFRREVASNVGPFREDLPVLGDWEFNLRFLQRADIGVLAEPLARYHVRPKANDPCLMNSINKASHLHEETFVRLRGEWLREDLRLGRFGLGSVVSLIHEQHARSQQELAEVSRCVRHNASFSLRLLRVVRHRVEYLAARGSNAVRTLEMRLRTKRRQPLPQTAGHAGRISPSST